MGQLFQSQAIERVESQTLPRVVFEKRRDHGAHRIVSVPAFPKQVSSCAPPTGAKEETQKEMHERHSTRAKEKGKEKESNGRDGGGGGRRGREGLKRDKSRERDGKLEKERKMRRLKEGGKRSCEGREGR